MTRYDLEHKSIPTPQATDANAVVDKECWTEKRICLHDENPKNNKMEDIE